jgi:hypothetical protein
MKWFKHFTNANRDDKLVWLRAKYGVKGIGQYWLLLEAVAEQMKGSDLYPEATFTKNQLATLLGVKQNQLTSLLVDYQNELTINSQSHENVIKISIPKLLKIKDNYHTDLEVSSKSLPIITKNKEEEVEVEVDKKKSIKEKSPRQAGLTYSPPFLEFYRFYPGPRKHGRIKPYGAWKNALKVHGLSEDELLRLCTEALTWQIKSEDWTKENGQYIPAPEVYLNQARWEQEEYDPIKAAKEAAKIKDQQILAELKERGAL